MMKPQIPPRRLVRTRGPVYEEPPNPLDTGVWLRAPPPSPSPGPPLTDYRAPMTSPPRLLARRMARALISTQKIKEGKIKGEKKGSSALERTEQRPPLHTHMVPFLGRARPVTAAYGAGPGSPPPARPRSRDTAAPTHPLHL